MAESTYITPESQLFLRVLHLLTPLGNGKYGAWAEDNPWARPLANLMGEQERTFGSDCLPWDAAMLERELANQGILLPGDLTMSEAIHKVAAGLAVNYAVQLRSVEIDAHRASRTLHEGAASDPFRSLRGTRLSTGLPDPWMKVIAEQILYALESSAAIKETWPVDKFHEALEEAALELPPEFSNRGESYGMELAIDRVLLHLEAANPAWFARNIGALMNRRILDIYIAQSGRSETPSSEESWTEEADASSTAAIDGHFVDPKPG